MDLIMSEKINTLRKTLINTEEGKTNLKIISLQGVFDCILMDKIYEENNLTKINVKTLENENPDYEKNNTLSIDLNDGGLIEIKII